MPASVGPAVALLGLLLLGPAGGARVRVPSVMNEEGAPPAVWPMPREAAWGPGRREVSPRGLRIRCTNTPCPATLREAVRRTEPRFTWPFCAPAGTAGPPPPGGAERAALKECTVAVRSTDETLRMGVDESYNLTVSGEAHGGCALTAATVWGALWGLDTLAQLCVQMPSGAAGKVALQEAEIKDALRFPFRGLLVDSARHFLPVPFLKRILDVMSLGRYNVLHWHLVDSQAFPVRSDLYPELAEKGAYDPLATYSKADLRAVVAYAKSRGVRVMPEFDVPGHGSWGAGRPELMGCADVLDPTKPEVYDFLKAFLGEMAAVFEDEYLFLGGDEVNTTCWDDNPGIAKWMKQRGLNSTQLFSYFWNRTSAEVLPGLGKKVGVWEADDVAVDMALLPADSFANTWTSNTSWGNVTAKGFPVVISGPYYLDQENPGGCAQYRWDQTWKCFYFAEPLEYLGAAARGLVRGKLAALWGEAVSSRNIESRAWPRASAIAERMWSPDWTSATRPAEDAVQQRLERHVCRLNKRGLAAGPVGPQFCPTDLDPAPKRPGGRGAGRAEF